MKRIIIDFIQMHQMKIELKCPSDATKFSLTYYFTEMKAINTIQRHSLGKLRHLISTTAAISTKSTPKFSLVHLIIKSKIPDEEKALLLEREIEKEKHLLLKEKEFLEKQLQYEKVKNQFLNSTLLCNLKKEINR